MTVAVTESARTPSGSARRIARVDATPPPAPGFIGQGHEAVEVLSSKALSSSDPFVLLMDDRLDIEPRRAIGGPHPHAGLETVTLVLEGSLVDREEGELGAGDAVWMTAGRGVIHNEHVEVEGRVRVLQLWIGLPGRARFEAPALQVLRASELPTLKADGVFVRLYSGRLGTLRSPTRNHVPVTLAEVSLAPKARVELELPASQTGFLYVISGELAAGADGRAVRASEVAWLDRPAPTGDAALSLVAGPAGARAVLYAGEPQNEPLVQHGPFVADSEATITQFYLEFRSGGFQRVSEL
jgi:quercetin 2,3-dioxygenase